MSLQKHDTSSYTISVEHLSIDNGEEEKQVYNKVLNVTVLDKSTPIFYDEATKLHFESGKGCNWIYELEIADVSVKLSSRLKKAEDFIRRVNYCYDWIQISVDNQGKVTSIKNEPELKQDWQELKYLLLADYEGSQVEKYLSRIDLNFNHNNRLFNLFSKYFYYGLLFPEIPAVHTKEWSKHRIIKLSDYDEDVFFNEKITFESTIYELRKYKISGNLENNVESLDLHQFEGEIIYNANDEIIENANVIINYSQEGSFVSQWSFSLTKNSI